VAPPCPLTEFPKGPVAPRTPYSGSCGPQIP